MSGGDQTNFTHTVGVITKHLQNLKNFQSPPPFPVKNDTSLIAEMLMLELWSLMKTAIYVTFNCSLIHFTVWSLIQKEKLYEVSCLTWLCFAKDGLRSEMVLYMSVI